MGTLTVDETLTAVADLRLPASYTRAQKQEVLGEVFILLSYKELWMTCTLMKFACSSISAQMLDYCLLCIIHHLLLNTI